MSTTNPHSAHLFAILHPRKPRQRTTFAALIVLVCLTTYIFIAHSAFLSESLSIRRSDPGGSADQLALALETIQNSHLSSHKHGQRKSHHHRPSLKFELHEELGAVSSFIASLPQNVIPHHVDPSNPIDPQLVLDFDTRAPHAKEEMQAMVEDVWLRNPVFLYSKLYSPPSREIKSILAKLNLRPDPTIIDVDVREDAEILTPMLKRLTRASELPVLLIGGKPVLATAEELGEMSKSGELQKLITAAGGVVNGAKRKKHRNH
ncbi:hypothetical protein NLJ89_g9535 [Agrocybe chaxingu]|uniref:Uncharacterized protein n=1 Tax=Agrocybe chaxingu TaxID=84603 RepID=A0A9W8JZT4_9AGAR|nr:hypothetical protein NLJ89_g9535 [Agrocybe chaxingu]